MIFKLASDCFGLKGGWDLRGVAGADEVHWNTRFGTQSI